VESAGLTSVISRADVARKATATDAAPKFVIGICLLAVVARLLLIDQPYVDHWSWRQKCDAYRSDARIQDLQVSADHKIKRIALPSLCCSKRASDNGAVMLSGAKHPATSTRMGTPIDSETVQCVRTWQMASVLK
jgi:hypothetical protein